MAADNCHLHRYFAGIVVDSILILRTEMGNYIINIFLFNNYWQWKY